MQTIDALLDRIASLEKQLEEMESLRNENERLKKRVEELEHAGTGRRLCDCHTFSRDGVTQMVSLLQKCDSVNLSISVGYTVLSQCHTFFWGKYQLHTPH